MPGALTTEQQINFSSKKERGKIMKEKGRMDGGETENNIEQLMKIDFLDQL